MITSVFGLPGSGKTLTLSWIVQRMLKNPHKANTRTMYFANHCIADKQYKQPIKIYTNFPCKGCYKLNFDDLGKKNFHHCMIIIDEIQLLADSRNFKNFGDNLVWFFTMARHKYCDVCYASQSFDTVDRKIRLVTDRLYYVDNFVFDFMRIRQIMSYFDISNDITMKYEFASGFNTKYLYRPKLYSISDSYACIKDDTEIDVPIEMWYDSITGGTGGNAPCISKGAYSDLIES